MINILKVLHKDLLEQNKQEVRIQQSEELKTLHLIIQQGLPREFLEIYHALKTTKRNQKTNFVHI